MNNYFGCNFKRLINSYRVARAKELLDGKDCPVSELFSRCGFASKSVFYVAFKKVVGMTPLQYISQSRSPFMIQRIIRKTKCFDFWERNVLFPKTKRSFFRTPKHPLPCPFPLNFSLLIITKKFGNLAKNRYICIV